MPNRQLIRITGHAGKDAQETTTDNGKPAVKFSVATSRGKEPNQKTTWWNITAYGKAGVENARHIKKGMAVEVDVAEVSAYKDSLQATSFDVYIIQWHKVPEDAQGAGNQPQGNREPPPPDDDSSLPF